MLQYLRQVMSVMRMFIQGILQCLAGPPPDYDMLCILMAKSPRGGMHELLCGSHAAGALLRVGDRPNLTRKRRDCDGSSTI
jgi:hypothetical protein